MGDALSQLPPDCVLTDAVIDGVGVRILMLWAGVVWPATVENDNEAGKTSSTPGPITNVTVALRALIGPWTMKLL